MILLVLNFIGALAAFLGAFVPFHDNLQALKDGVFSATTIAGYSIHKSIFLYAVYLAGAFFCAWWLRVKRPRSFPADAAQEDTIMRVGSVSSKEWIAIGILVAAVFMANIILRETIFTQATLYSEEFYNLAAMQEFTPGTSFALAYPYSYGHLFLARLAQAVGLPFFFYLFIFNGFALILLYVAISVYIKKISHRLMAFTGIVLFYIQPILQPSLHRNIGRFFIPVFVVISLTMITEHTFRSRYGKILSLSFFHAALLFFGSADTIAIGYILYALFVLLLWQQKRLEPVYVWSVFIGLGIIICLFGADAAPLIKGQLDSIRLYSGYANTTPYFNLFSPVHSLGQLLKYVSSAIIYYLPFVILFNLILYLISQYKRERLVLSSRYVQLALFTVAYILYFRQNFGDAGIGRIGIASSPLPFIFFILRDIARDRLWTVIHHLIILFMVVISSVSLYFFRYSLLDMYGNVVARSQAAERYTPCADTFFAEKLTDAGFARCDAGILMEIKQMKDVAQKEQIYVFDDTFSLYYFLDARPIVLIPTYYSSRTHQALVLDMIRGRGVRYIIEPRIGHFFGVPEAFVHDPAFMADVRAFMRDHARLVQTLPHYYLYSIE